MICADGTLSNGKTDYYARQRLTLQDKNKYNSPKYRFTVRFTNRDVICQVQYATIAGDVTICSAYSHELPKYGMKAGLTNYAATYATGLLCARRLLTKYDLAETYEGNTENLGEDYNVEAEGDRRPFKCYLDTGLVRTSTGSRVFAALKGAVDGGLDIPHSDKRYAGYDLQDKSLDPETLERYIKGGVVAEYAEEMQEEVSDCPRPQPSPAAPALATGSPPDGFFRSGVFFRVQEHISARASGGREPLTVGHPQRAVSCGRD